MNCSRGDKLEVGDHLASINGASVFQKNVTEVCKILAASKSTDDIHLVFIRYIGPIRNSNAIEQQGYEVIDPQVEKAKAKAEKQRQRNLATSSEGKSMSPVKLSRSLSRLGAKKPQNHDPPKENTPPAATIKNETIIAVVQDDSKKKRRFFPFFKKRRNEAEISKK